MAKPKAILTNPWLLGGVIAAAALAVYIPAMGGDFTWDDEWLVYDSPLIQAPDGLYRIWFTGEAPDYFPVTWSTLWVEWRLWGAEAAGYRVTNIVLHAISAVLVWRLLLCLRVPGAWLAAAVFAVHPVNVESVAWISQRKNVLAMVFCLPAALAYFRSQRGAHKGWYAASLVLFALALLSKTAVVMLPVALLVLTWYRRGRLGLRDLAVATPMLAMSLVMGIVTIVFDLAFMVDKVIRLEGPAGRVASSGWVVWFYLYKAFVPVRLSMMYPRWQVAEGAIVSYVPLALLVACFVGLWLARRAGWARAVLAGLGCFVIVLFPVLGFIDDPYWAYSFVADRHQYFAIIAALALAAAGCAKLAAPGAAARRRACTPIAAAVLCVLAALTWHRAGLFASDEALWRDALVKNPDEWAVHGSLARALRQAGPGDPDKLAEAARHLAHALELSPGNPKVHAEMAITLALSGRLDEAEHHFSRIVALKPQNAWARLNLGMLLRDRGRTAEALEHLQACVRLAPDDAGGHTQLGLALVAAGRSADAADEYAIAVSLDPTDRWARFNLGKVLNELGRSGRALEHLVAYVQLAPDDPEGHVELGIALAATGQRPAAAGEFAEAMRLDPASEKAAELLIAVLLEQGKPAEAVRRYRELLAARGETVALLNNLAWLLATWPDEGVRDGPEALRLAERARELTGGNNAVVLDTLAAALAEVGRFDQAVSVAAQAAKLAEAAGDKDLLEQCRARLELYKSKRPYRRPRPG